MKWIVSTTKEFKFCAAHVLPQHNGKCGREHGHNYKLQVIVRGEIKTAPGSDCGMVMDFSDVKAIVNEHIIDRLDHRHLNQVLGQVMSDTTAENLACWMFMVLNAKIIEHYQAIGEEDRCVWLEGVRLYETDSGWVDVTRRDARQATKNQLKEGNVKR